MDRERSDAATAGGERRLVAVHDLPDNGIVGAALSLVRPAPRLVAWDATERELRGEIDPPVRTSHAWDDDWPDEPA